MKRTAEELEALASRIPHINGVPATQWHPRDTVFETEPHVLPRVEIGPRQTLKVTYADELPDAYEPPDELVQGVLTTDGGSMWYGASNTGKTFLVIDLAASVARGVPWMDRHTEQGLVVYIAAESPSSVRSRLQAYQHHHHCKVPDFAIVQSPMNLWNTDDDTNLLIPLVQQIEQERSKKVRLIVGDTLARLSAGANENSGQDMGKVVARIDRIRAECKAHFLMIHHSGKTEAYGARGWSGIRAAVDTEVEITEGSSGRCAEITKQRDLPSKGQRIGFRLEHVHLGQTKWGGEATTCVIAPAASPPKAAGGKSLGKVEGAVLDLLASQCAGVKKSMVVQHLKDQLQLAPSSVYAAIKSLAEKGMAHLTEHTGMVCISEALRPKFPHLAVQSSPVLSSLDLQDKGKDVQYLSSPVQPPYRGWTTGQTGQPQNTIVIATPTAPTDSPEDVDGEVF
jgi:putative DNA primase/helicase